MKYFAILALAIFLASHACADIGPSASYSFSISNADEYQNYDFYYAGQIWPTRLEPANPATYVYKFNTSISVYAVPKGVDVHQFSEADFDELVSQSVVSQSIELDSGSTTFKVASFDPNAGTMTLVVESHSPDTDYGASYLLWVMFPFIVIAVIIAVIAIVAVLAARFLLRKGQKK